MTDTLLPQTAFEQALGRLLNLPNGAHTEPTVVQAVDFYGNATAYIVQTVKWDEGETAFVTVIKGPGADRFILPPKVLQVIDRQRESTRTQVRRKHGRRLVEEGKLRPGTGFTPEARTKALATRKRKAAARHARRQQR